MLRAMDGVRDRARRLGQPRLEAAATRMTLCVYGDLKQPDRLAGAAEPTLARWPDDPDVQFLVRGTWGQQYAYNRRYAAAGPLLEEALALPGVDNDHERLGYLLSAGTSVGQTDPEAGLRYAAQAYGLARESDRLAPLAAAKAAAEYAVATYLRTGDRAGAVAAFPACSDALKRLWAANDGDPLWRDAMVMFGHHAGFLAQYARDGAMPTATRDGSRWVPPERGVYAGFRADRAALYQVGAEAALCWLMGEYAEAARDDGEAAYWLAQAGERSRLSGVTFARSVIDLRRIPGLLRAGLYEDAVEATVTTALGMYAQHQHMATHPQDIDGIGIDLTALVAGLSTDDRRQADRAAAMLGLVPAALRIVQVSRDQSDVASNAARRVAAMCRQAATREGAGPVWWAAAAEFFDWAAEESPNAITFLNRVHRLDGDAFTNLRVLGYVLATWHAGVSHALHCQLATVELLHTWYRANDPVRRQVLLPYFESFWRHAARHARFMFRTPGRTAAAIEAAADGPEAGRIPGVLLAATEGIPVNGLETTIKWLRGQQDG